MPQIKLSEKNPLIEYKEQHMLTWDDVAKKCGLSMQGVYNIARMTRKELGLCRVNTAIIFKKELGIDLVKFLSKN